MKTHITLYLIALAVFLPIDLLWIGVVARDFYRDSMGALMADRPRMAIGLIFYALFLVGLVIFGMRAGIAANDWKPAALWGALFGFFCYATYDLTCLAVMKDYPVKLALVDLAWGTIISGVTSALAVLIGKALLGDLSVQ
jgi:uncharacterized membrane protein